MTSKKPFRNLSGLRFGKLIAIKFIERKNNRTYWEFKCDCGKIKILWSSNVVSGITQSCGCFQKELQIIKNKTLLRKYSINRSNKLDSIMYERWNGMIQRCYNINDERYKYYGQRGICVHKDWHNFENFYKDMGYPPTLKHSLERKNNNDGYSKDNCYWATNKEQSRNKRNNIFWTLDKETLCIADWALKLNIPDSVLRNRKRLGWSIEKTLKTPCSKKC